MKPNTICSGRSDSVNSERRSNYKTYKSGNRTTLKRKHLGNLKFEKETCGNYYSEKKEPGKDISGKIKMG